jgi:hypothetical protein
MFFTQEDYRKIEKWLLANNRKDTDFVGAATPLKGNETVVLVQDGKNVKTSVKDIVDQFFLLGVSDFLNITDKYGESYISIDQAIQLIPFRSRKEGQVITFLNTDGNWEIYQFTGKLNQWNNPTLWNNPFDWEKFIFDSILPDEEDLTKSLPDENGNAYLSLKDREYNPEDFSGLGRVILRKNIVEIDDPIYGKVKKNVLYPDMISNPNTIYEIRYDFDLNGAEIELKEGCTLKFKGGKFKGGCIHGNYTTIDLVKEQIFDTSISLKGNWNSEWSFPEWFGAKGDGLTDDTESIQKCIDFACENRITMQLNKEKYLVKNGGLLIKSHLHLYSKVNSTILTNSGLNDKDYYSFIIGCTSNETGPLVNINGYGFEDIYIEGITFNQNREYYEPKPLYGDQHGGDCIFIYGVKDIVVNNCTFLLKGSNAIQIGRYTNTNIRISNNLIHNCERKTNHDQSAIYVEGTHCHILNNTIIDDVNKLDTDSSCMDGGIEVHGLYFVATGNIIKNVRFAFNISSYRGSLLAPKSGLNLIANNEVYCDSFIVLWGQGENDSVVLGNLTVAENVCTCQTVIGTIYSEQYKAKIENITIKNNKFEGIPYKITTSSILRRAVRFVNTEYMESISICYNIFSGFVGGLIWISTSKTCEGFSVYNNIFEDCFKISEKEYNDYIYLFEFSHNINNTIVRNNIFTFYKDSIYVSLFCRDNGTNTKFVDNQIESCYQKHILETTKRIISLPSQPTSGTYNINDYIICNDGSKFYISESGTIRTGTLSGNLCYYPDTYLELNTIEGLEVGDYLSIATEHISKRITRVTAIIGNKVYLENIYIEGLEWGIVETLTEVTYSAFKLLRANNVTTMSVTYNSSPENPIVGQIHFDTHYKKPFFKEDYAWIDVNGLKKGSKEYGSLSDRPSDSSFIPTGTKFFVTTNSVPIFFEGVHDGYLRWVSADGYDVGYKRRGTTAERPTYSSYMGDMEGMTYYDTTLKKFIVWNGTDWTNIDGTPLT